MKIGYALSSEEFAPKELVDLAKRAEEVGFEFAVISDHFHPWLDRQGQSPFVWTTIGAIARETERLRLGTAVTCPINRIHPMIIAQAAATAGALMPGRFFLGVGTGENLNEHINGRPWPEPGVRLEMLEEAVGVIRFLWSGGFKSVHGKYFTVENARIYSLPQPPPPIYVAAAAPQAVELAARIGDGLISTNPSREVVVKFRASGHDRPRFGGFTACVAESEALARSAAFKHWPNAGLPADLKQELSLPEHFEQAVKLVSEDEVAERIVCGPDPERHFAKIAEYAEAGFDHVYVHQVGPVQETFFRLYQREILPKFKAAA
jgi:coenzyme F420-dependent glucose-6-phosphate dehydrogenase